MTSASRRQGSNLALGASLIFGLSHHHNTTSKVEQINGVIADVLHSFAGERADDCPALVPPVEFAINDSASPLGTGYTPFYADRGQHPRRPLTPSAAPDPAGSGEAAAHLMGRVTAEVRALLQERQDRRKEELDASGTGPAGRAARGGGRGAAGQGSHAPHDPKFGRWLVPGHGPGGQGTFA